MTPLLGFAGFWRDTHNKALARGTDGRRERESKEGIVIKDLSKTEKFEVRPEEINPKSGETLSFSDF